MVEQIINPIRQEKKKLMKQLNITSGKKFRKAVKKLRKGGLIKMPRVKCRFCGHYSYGWALLYMPCHCECGNFLPLKDVEKDYEQKEDDVACQI